MSNRTRSILLGSAVAFALVSSAGLTKSAEAFYALPVPFFFPIAECGTVVLVDQTFPWPDGDPEGGCLAWEADSGGAYLVGGLEAFNVGDRIFVEGQNCFTCLTTCAAGAILNAEISACSGDDK